MNYKRILVTGGAGFIGSHICIKLKNHFQNVEVIALDNLVRRGSELNLPRLKKHGVTFRHGDIRNDEDLDVGKVDLLVECSAEPSVMAGISSSPSYVIQANLMGAVNCFERARKTGADVVFLSTSRVYSMQQLNAIRLAESKTRFEVAARQTIPGITQSGISESFPVTGNRTFYGTTKLAAELLLSEYIEYYGVRAVIDRFGVIAGPWQMGKVDQGIATYWMGAHVFDYPLTYFGYGGRGLQVRDLLHVDDLFDLLLIQLNDIKRYSGEIYNAGGGKENSVSLRELTTMCKEISGRSVAVGSAKEDRKGDVRLYISDYSRLRKATGWSPKKSVHDILSDIHTWMEINKRDLSHVFAP